MKTELKPSNLKERSYVSSLSLDGRYTFGEVENAIDESKVNNSNEIEVRQDRLEEHYRQRTGLSDQHD